MLIQLLMLVAQLSMPQLTRTVDTLVRENDRFAYLILADSPCTKTAQEFEDRARSLLQRYQSKDFVVIEWYSSDLERAIDESRSNVIGDDTFGRWQYQFSSKTPKLWGQALKIGSFQGLRRHCDGAKFEIQALSGGNLFHRTVDGVDVRFLDFRLLLQADGASSLGLLHLQAEDVTSTATASKLCEHYFRQASRYEGSVRCVIGEDAIRPLQVYLVHNPFVDIGRVPQDMSDLKALYTCDGKHFKSCNEGPM